MRHEAVPDVECVTAEVEHSTEQEHANANPGLL